MQPVRILIVEDERIVAKDLARQLQKMGHCVVGEATSGEEAVRAVAELQPQLVLMDIRLQGPMDGVETAAAIHTRSDAPIVYLTAHADEATVQRAKLTEPFGYILKPFEERDLQVAIEMTLYKHHTEHTVRRSMERVQMLHDINRAILEAQAPRDIAQAALQKLQQVIPYTRGGVVFLNRITRTGRLFAVYPPFADIEIEALEYPPISQTHLETLLAGEVFYEPDLWEKVDAVPGYAMLKQQGVRSFIAAPLHLEGEWCGSLSLGADRQNAFHEDFLEITRQVAAPLALAIQHARLNEQLLEQQQQETKRVESELERARQQLVQQTRLAAVGQVAASIAHDLRNPLGSIRNAAYLLKRSGPRSDERWKQYLGVIEEEIQTADEIIGDLLEITRAKEPQPHATNLITLLEDVVRRLNPPLGVTWRYVYASEPFLVWADLGQLQRVFSNIFLNAIQAMNGQGVIEVTATQTEGWDVVTIVDTGPGVALENRRAIFEPLFTTKAKGTGLGLTICQQIIERHGGSIEILPSAAGGGFRLTLPHEGGAHWGADQNRGSEKTEE